MESTLNRLVRAQLVYVGQEVDGYLTRGDKFALDALREGERDPTFTLGQMPHQWGSVDSWLYMRDAFQVMTEMMDALYDDAIDGSDDESVKGFLRGLIRDKDIHHGFCDEVVDFANLGSYNPETDSYES